MYGWDWMTDWQQSCGRAAGKCRRHWLERRKLFVIDRHGKPHVIGAISSIHGGQYVQYCLMDCCCARSVMFCTIPSNLVDACKSTSNLQGRFYLIMTLRGPFYRALYMVIQYIQWTLARSHFIFGRHWFYTCARTQNRFVIT